MVQKVVKNFLLGLTVSFKDNNKIIIGLTDCDKEKLSLNLFKELKELSKYAQ